jgi:hypothetical protein
MDDKTNPAHYKSKAGIEAIDVIEAFNLGYCLGNVIKYVLRAEKKGEKLADLKKARWYLNRYIDRMDIESDR